MWIFGAIYIKVLSVFGVSCYVCSNVSSLLVYVDLALQLLIFSIMDSKNSCVFNFEAYAVIFAQLNGLFMILDKYN